MRGYKGTPDITQGQPREDFVEISTVRLSVSSYSLPTFGTHKNNKLRKVGIHQPIVFSGSDQGCVVELCHACMLHHRVPP